jgi:hypothetical protein
MDKSILLSNDKKSSLTPKRRNLQSSSKRTASDSKSRFSDRFIPSSINKNLIEDFESTAVPDVISKKSEQNYMKLLQTDILEEKTPSILSLN